MKEFRLVCLFSFFLLSSCAHYFLGERIETKEIRTQRKIDISYELIGWEHDDYKPHASEVLSQLHTSLFFGKIASAVKSPLENRIQIILMSNQFIKPLFGEQTEPVSWMIERKPGTTLLTMGNRILSYRSFLIFPYFVKNDTQILFRHWKGNLIQKDYTYSLNNLVIVGWIPLLLRPFDEHEQLNSMYKNIAQQFISDFQEVNQ